MGDVTEIIFSTSKSMELRMSKMRRICNVGDDAELMRLTGLGMYHLDSRVRHGGSIVMRGVEYRILVRDDE